MRFLGYIFTYGFIWLIHLLPERILYCFSDFLYLIMHYVVGYRRKVVYNNIAKAFPNYGKQEIRQTSRRFYHHLCDLILETAISYFYSETKALRKMTYRNPEILEDYYRKGKQVMAVTGHYGNWEYLSTLGLFTEYSIIAIYKPLNNKYFDRMVRKNRTRFGIMVSPMDKIARNLIGFHQEKKPVLTVFLSDQRPMYHQIQYWTKFLGLDTPIYLGIEKLARKLDAAVVFLKVRKVQRGKYETEIVPICQDPNSLKPHEITEAHVRILEELIREDPGLWLWSHRRWKHSMGKYRNEHGQ